MLPTILLAFLFSPHFFSPSFAVDIGFGNNCGITRFTCTNIVKGTCCSNPNALFDHFVVFRNYPYNPLFTAIAYDEPAGGTGCGRECNHAFGNQGQICMECDILIGGAEWHMLGKLDLRHEGGHKRRDRHRAVSCVKPDKASIDGVDFNINYGVPEDVTQAIISMVLNQTLIEDVPAAYRRYQAV